MGLEFSYNQPVSQELYNRALAFTTTESGDQTVNIDMAEHQELEELAVTDADREFVSQLRDKANVARLASFGAEANSLEFTPPTAGSISSKGNSDALAISTDGQIQLDSHLLEETSLSVEALKERYDYVSRQNFSLQLTNNDIQALVMDDSLSFEAFQQEVQSYIGEIRTHAAEAAEVSFPTRGSNVIHSFPPPSGGLFHEISPADRTTYEAFIAVAGEYSSTEELAEHRQEVLETVLNQVTHGAYDQLPEGQKAQLQQFMEQFSLQELMSTAIQGEGGDDKGSSHNTASGIGGQYVNPLLSSVGELINTGRLSPEVLSAMNDLTTTPLHPEMEAQKQELIQSTIQDVAFPERVAQHNKGTCVASSIQIHYILEQPQNYIQLVAGLASPSGQVGEPIIHGRRPMERDNDTLTTDNSGRSVSNRLVGASFMEFANGRLWEYHNLEDTHSILKDNSGLFQFQGTRLMNALMGDNYRNLSALVPRDRKLDLIETALDKGYTVPTGISWGTNSGHEINISRIDRDNDTVYFMNPWGELHTMAFDEFYDRLRFGTASIPRNLDDIADRPGDAMDNIPGLGGDPSSYSPIEPPRFMHPNELLESEGVEMSGQERRQLRRALKSHDLFSGGVVNQMMHILADSATRGPFIEQMQALDSEEDYANIVSAISNANRLVDSQLVPTEVMSRLVSDLEANADILAALANNESSMAEALENGLLSEADVHQLVEHLVQNPDARLPVSELLEALPHVRTLEQQGHLDFEDTKNQLFETLSRNDDEGLENARKIYFDLAFENGSFERLEGLHESGLLDDESLLSQQQVLLNASSYDQIQSIRITQQSIEHSQDLLRRLDDQGLLDFRTEVNHLLALVPDEQAVENYLQNIEDIAHSLQSGGLTPEDARRLIEIGLTPEELHRSEDAQTMSELNQGVQSLSGLGDSDMTDSGESTTSGIDASALKNQ